VKRLSEAGILDAMIARLTCPIGIPGVGGKEPGMIAVSVAAQLLQNATAVVELPARRANASGHGAP
jgi:xanthine dehydrogenase accessory factor